MSSRFRLAYVGIAAIASFSALACVDPKKTFDDFGDRVIDAAPAADTGACMGGLFDVTGEYLLSIQLQGGSFRPIRFIASVAYEEVPPGATADLTIQPIADPMCPAGEGMGGEPVGDALQVDDLPVDAAGCFQIVQQDTIVPAAANSILCADTEADVTFSGAVVAEDTFCGTVDVVAALTLSGTFGVTPIEPGTTGDANLPDPVTDCPSGG